jgi:uncharacterized protein YraI
MSIHPAPRRLGLAALVLALLPLAAAAQEAFTRGDTNMRAGPASEYPLVARLESDVSVNVVGCTDGYGWCDITLSDGLRGWVRADRLEYAYEGNEVPLASYGAVIGVPIVGFALGNYWSDHYRDRPWYRESRWWGRNVPPPMVPGWRPAPPPAMGWAPRPPAPGWNAPPAGRPGWNGGPPRAPQWEGRQPQWEGREPPREGRQPQWEGRQPAWEGRAPQPVMPQQPRPMPPQPQMPPPAPPMAAPMHPPVPQAQPQFPLQVPPRPAMPPQRPPQAAPGGPGPGPQDGHPHRQLDRQGQQ